MPVFTRLKKDAKQKRAEIGTSPKHLVSIALPFVPGSYVTKTGKYIIKSSSKVDDVVDTLKTLNKADRINAIKDGAIALPYKALKKLTKGTGLQAHHLIEKRFASKLGLTADEILSVAIDTDTHEKITKAFRSKIPYNSSSRNSTKLSTLTASPQNIWDAIVEVYTEIGETEYLPELKEILKDAGHNLDWKGW